MSYFNSITQNVIADANNSSTTNLDTPTFAFTGTYTSTLGVAGIQVSLFANKNCKIIVQQSQDHTNWDISDIFYYTASSSFGITVQAVSSYVRVLVTTNQETTTAFRLQTALCPIVEAVPRSPDENGNFKIGNPMDNYGFKSENTPMGEMRMIEPVRLAGTIFDNGGNAGAVDANFWTATITNSATITQANAQVTLDTKTTAANGTATLNSVRKARYVAGSSNRFRATIQLSAGATDNRRRWGIAFGATMPTITDGIWFELNGSTFGIGYKKSNGADSVVTAFNGQLGASYSPGTNAVTYEIYYTNSKVWWVIGDQILHSISFTSSTITDTPNYYIFMDNVNSNAAQTSNTLVCRVASVCRLGKLETAPITKNITGVNSSQILKYGAGVLHNIVIGTPVNNATITIYDNTTGTGNPIGVITLPNSATPFAMDFGSSFYNGLNIVPSSATLNLTVNYE